METREELLQMAKNLQQEATKLSKDTKMFKEAMEAEVKRREQLAVDMHNMAVKIRKLLEEM